MKIKKGKKIEFFSAIIISLITLILGYSWVWFRLGNIIGLFWSIIFSVIMFFWVLFQMDYYSKK